MQRLKGVGDFDLPTRLEPPRVHQGAASRGRQLTNFRGWRRVWGEPGENRGGTGGEPGAPKRTGGEPGAFGKRAGGEPGAFGIHLQRVPGEKRGLWDKNRGRTGGREFSLEQETQLGT